MSKLEIEIRKSVTLPRNALFERTADKMTACVEGCSALITPRNTEIDVHLTLTSSLIMNLIGFHLSIIIRDSILGIFSVQINYSSDVHFLDWLQKFTTGKLKSYVTVLG